MHIQLTTLQMNKQNSRFSSLSGSLSEGLKKTHADQPKNIPIVVQKQTQKRFNFTVEELQVKKDSNKQEFRPSNDKYRRGGFRERPSIQFEREQRIKQEADAVERKKVEIQRSLSDTSSFPELSGKVTKVDKKTLNYLETVKWVDDTEEVPIEWYDGLSVLGSDPIVTTRKSIRPKSSDEVMGRLVELYETWKANYIAEYGEEYYERHYRFPNYDYEYFDKLDEKYEAEMDEMERMQEEKDRDQYTEYNCHQGYDE